MTSKEIVRANIRHQSPTRLAWDFYDSRYKDIAYMASPRIISAYGDEYSEWGDHPALSEKCHFDGETRIDVFGNILGRYGGRTKGECIKGALQDGWEGFDDYRFPTLDETWKGTIPEDARDKYILCGMPVGVFSVLRDVRRIDNALMDTVLEPEMVEAFLDKIVLLMIDCVRAAASSGADGIMFGDDWGTQTSSFISPASFRALFKPAYKRIADACDELDIDMLFHSCGCVAPLVDDMIEAGIDAFQFDQPELSGVEYWAEKYGKKACFYCPVDIQKILPTGDRRIIEEGAKRMADAFTKVGGGLIAKDYGGGPESWADIQVSPEWVDWARDVITANSDIR